MQPGLRLLVCTLLPSVLISQGQIRVGGGTGAPSIMVGSVAGVKEKGKRWKPGWGRAVWELQGLCGDFGDREGCWQAAPPPTAQGFRLVQPLPGCTRWLRTIPLAPGKSVLGRVAGGRHQGVGEGRAGCVVQIPLLCGIPAHPKPPWGRGCTRPQLP